MFLYVGIMIILVVILTLSCVLWKKTGVVYVSEFWKLILAFFLMKSGKEMTEVSATILHIFGYVLLIWFVVSIINKWSRRKTVE